jgi:hypothetical protein
LQTRYNAVNLELQTEARVKAVKSYARVH